MKRLLLALAAGLLVAFSLPPWGWWPLAFVGVALFELAASDPRGFRTLGSMTLRADGILRSKYDELRGRGEILTGSGTVHEGDGKRAIVLSHDDGSTVTTLWKDLP